MSSKSSDREKEPKKYEKMRGNEVTKENIQNEKNRRLERIDEETLVKDLSNGAVPLRLKAAKVLGAKGDEGSVGPLIHALKDNDRRVRMEAARSLGKIGGESAVIFLSQALNDKHESVRGTARIALIRIIGTKKVQEMDQSRKEKEEIRKTRKGQFEYRWV
nr:HEAT repeat domain-containing protein [Candidatus Freyarchaeota archaeon]